MLTPTPVATKVTILIFFTALLLGTCDRRAVGRWWGRAARGPDLSRRAERTGPRSPAPGRARSARTPGPSVWRASPSRRGRASVRGGGERWPRPGRGDFAWRA